MNQQMLLFETPVDRTGLWTNHLGIPGLVYCRDFILPSEQKLILDEVDSRPWQSDLKRRVQHYGYKYDYKARRIDRSMYVGELPEFAVDLGRRLVGKRLVGEIPDQLIVNEYLPGQGITPHVDCEPCFKGTIITISLGSVYVMDLMEIDGVDTREVSLELGSALALSGDARYRWTHGIKARKTDRGRPRGRRVSLTFRNVIIEE